MTSIKDDLPELIPVEGKDGLYRDVTSTAIVKDNQDEYDNNMLAVGFHNGLIEVFNLNNKLKETLSSKHKNKIQQVYYFLY